MMHRPRLRALAAPLLAAVIVFGAAGCGGSEAAPSGEEITVVDALGRTVTLPGVPDRITVAGRGAFMIFDALYLFPEGADRLVGLEAGRQSNAAFAALVDPALDAKTILEKNAGAEEVAATRPDLVLLKSYMASDLGEPLEQLGIPVVYLDLETPEQYQRDLALLGALLAQPERAEEAAAFYRDRAAAIAEAAAGPAAAARPQVLVLQYSAAEGTATFEVPPVSWLQTTMVDLAGGDPVWAEAGAGAGWITVGFEQIAAWDPDQIYVISYSGDTDGVVDALRTDPAWQALQAVQGGQLYGWPGDVNSWDQPDTRWILGLTWLFTKVQPEAAAGIDLPAEIEALFTQLYGLTPAEVEAEVLPTLFGSVP
ncbi:MAG: ABC transporter substrate-binding protein [Acidimicrobiia bacterium]|nr:ABC transporter substrate-binding protein [Acidimicrobiia bacterium]